MVWFQIPYRGNLIIEVLSVTILDNRKHPRVFWSYLDNRFANPIPLEGIVRIEGRIFSPHVDRRNPPDSPSVDRTGWPTRTGTITLRSFKCPSEYSSPQAPVESAWQ